MIKKRLMRITICSVFIACMFTACPTPPGGDYVTSAIGWIGDGQTGWRTGNAPPDLAYDYQSFYCPAGVYVDGSGNIYVADIWNDRISKWDATGNAIGWIGGGQNGWQTGSAPSSGSDDYQSFYNPSGVCVDGPGNIYVADFANNRISKWK